MIRSGGTGYQCTFQCHAIGAAICSILILAILPSISFAQDVAGKLIRGFRFHRVSSCSPPSVLLSASLRVEGKHFC
jgi:hypothetical protein